MKTIQLLTLIRQWINMNRNKCAWKVQHRNYQLEQQKSINWKVLITIILTSSSSFSTWILFERHTQKKFCVLSRITIVELSTVIEFNLLVPSLVVFLREKKAHKKFSLTVSNKLESDSHKINFQGGRQTMMMLRLEMLEIEEKQTEKKSYGNLEVLLNLSRKKL